MEDLGWSEDDQDKVIHLMSSNTKFLAKCVRKKIKPDLFSSDVRRSMVKMVLGYFQRYERAPADDLIDLVAEVLSKKPNLDGDSDIYSVYLVKINDISRQNISPDFVLDRIDHFIKKRVATMLTNRLVKLQDRFDIDPDRPIELLREALQEVTSIVGDNYAEALTDIPAYEATSDTATCFNVKWLDNALGGGLKFGSYVILLGYTNIGKSWAMAHLCKYAVRLGNSALYIPVEMANRIARMRLRMAFSGLDQRAINQQPQTVQGMIQDSLMKKSNILLLSDEEKGMNVTDLPLVLDDIEERHGMRPRLILLDSADDMEAPVGRYNSKLDENTALHTWLKNYAKDEEICIVTTVQSQRGGENRWWLTSGTVGENIYKARRATVGISINASPGEIELGYHRLYLFKHTDGPVGAKVWAKRDFSKGQFVMDSGRYIHQEYWAMLREAGFIDQETWKTGARGKKPK